MPVSADLQVLIPYRDLETLLAAARELPLLRKELSLCHEQFSKCQAMQSEILEKYYELYKMI